MKTKIEEEKKYTNFKKFIITFLGGYITDAYLLELNKYIAENASRGIMQESKEFIGYVRKCNKCGCIILLSSGVFCIKCAETEIENKIIT